MSPPPPLPSPIDRVEISILCCRACISTTCPSPRRLFQHGRHPLPSRLFLFSNPSFNGCRIQQKVGITMALLSLTCLASLISSFLIMIPSATASVRIQAAAPPPTPAASLILNGFSPRPTNPPGSNGVPRELLRRAAGIQFPPPDNWCGFIEGDYSQS